MSLTPEKSLHSEQDEDNIAKLMEQAARDLGYVSAKDFEETEPALYAQYYEQALSISKDERAI